MNQVAAPLVAVEWEDITAYSRTALPEDFEPYRLRKLTCGLLWKDTPEYVVVVGDYDITNEGRDYRHNDFRVRTVHMHDDESPNGHSHCLQLMLGTSESVPVADGELLLGTWQRIFLVELDGPRSSREVVIQALGAS